MANPLVSRAMTDESFHTRPARSGTVGSGMRLDGSPCGARASSDSSRPSGAKRYLTDVSFLEKSRSRRVAEDGVSLRPPALARHTAREHPVAERVRAAHEEHVERVARRDDKRVG